MNKEFAGALLCWYETNGRELPWRGTTDPYLIWISEVILQQTRVAQGYDYFIRFIRKFPTVESLANASLDEVLVLWQGLGYYSRARNLYEAARDIVANGGFPRTYEEVRALKGIGDYTAAAIVSFAYNQPRAVVDGNVYRILARYFGIDTPIDTGHGKKLFQTLAQELLPPNDVSRYNQAIMDFGALQCTPRQPACASCPLLDSCVAYSEHKVADLPVKNHETKVRDRFFAYICVRWNNEILLRKRGNNDIWKGLFEMPLVEDKQEISLLKLEQENWNPNLLILLRKDIRHQLSHQLLHVDLYQMKCQERPMLEGIWVSPSEMQHYAVSRLMANLLAICDGAS